MKDFYTLIVVPSGQARFRRIQVPARLLKLTVALLTMAQLFAGAFLVYLALRPSLARTGETTIDIDHVAAELQSSTTQLESSLRRAAEAQKELLLAMKQQDAELQGTRTRYAELRALTSGQEELARTYRKILRDANWQERLGDQTVGFGVGIFSSLCASFLFSLWRSKRESGTLGNESESDLEAP